MLLSLINVENTCVTNFVSSISESKMISKTSVWHTVRKLSSLGLINCSSSKNKGTPVTLTDTGRAVALSILMDIRLRTQSESTGEVTPEEGRELARKL